MNQIRRSLLASLCFALLLIGALPTFAGSKHPLNLEASEDACILTVSFSFPNLDVLKQHFDHESLKKRDVGGGTVYLYIPEIGVGEAITGNIGDLITREYSLGGVPLSTYILISVYGGEGGSSIGFDDTAIVTVEDCSEFVLVPATPDCPYPPSPLLGQATIPGAITTYWAPNLSSATTGAGIVTLQPGSSWWVITARDGFYKLFIACQAQYVWVTANSVIPNPNAPWNGRALPDAGTLPN